MGSNEISTTRWSDRKGIRLQKNITNHVESKNWHLHLNIIEEACVFFLHSTDRMRCRISMQRQFGIKFTSNQILIWSKLDAQMALDVGNFCIISINTAALLEHRCFGSHMVGNTTYVYAWKVHQDTSESSVGSLYSITTEKHQASLSMPGICTRQLQIL